MANEVRLIDANALIKECDRLLQNTPFAHPATPWDRGLQLAAVTALRMPTVDAVEVVRCYDCISCKVILDNVGAGHWHCKKRYGLPEVDPTDFCSYGERRDGE